MLAALGNAGHGIDLDTVHRFDDAWEAEASLGLRAGNPTVLTAYRDHRQLHACTDTADAVQAVHDRWRTERAAGREVLMMARTRADVDTPTTSPPTASTGGPPPSPPPRWQPGRRKELTAAIEDGERSGFVLLRASGQGREI